MIGNDVVDFKKALLESNWHRKGYLEKLFSVEEQHGIASADDPDRMVWLLWTMKEASYKIHFRHFHRRSFQPQKILCSPAFISEHSAYGQVHYDGQRYFSRSILTENFVHTVSIEQPVQFNEIRVIIERDCHGIPGFLRENHLQDYRIIKDDHHVPMLLNRNTGEKQILSISHHGRFTSFVYRSKQTTMLVCQ